MVYVRIEMSYCFIIQRISPPTPFRINNFFLFPLLSQFHAFLYSWLRSSTTIIYFLFYRVSPLGSFHIINFFLFFLLPRFQAFVHGYVRIQMLSIFILFIVFFLLIFPSSFHIKNFFFFLFFFSD